MLKAIKIENFQSHENTALEFSPGITAIIGESDSGKSAIMRAIRWVVDNRPNGDGFISWWNFTKGKMSGTTKVTIETDDAVVAREKNKDGFNGYYCNDTTYGTVGTDVPLSTQEALNINEMNIHRQFESHFLLSMNAGDVAKYLNKLVKLDVIDTVIQNGTSEQRDVNGKLKTASQSKKEAEDTINSYSWIPVAESLLKEIQDIETQCNVLETDGVKIKEAIQKIELANSEINKYSTLVTSAKSIIDEIAMIDSEYNKLDEAWSGVSAAIGRIKQADDVLKNKQIVDSSLGIMEMITSVSAMIDSDIKIMEQLGSAITTIGMCDTNITKYRAELEIVKASMPELCPTCGQPIKGDVCL